MNDRIQVSAWSIRHNTGPIVLTLRQEDGEIAERAVTDGAENIRLRDLPIHMKTEFGVSGVELMDYNVVRAPREEQDALVASLQANDIALGCLCIENRCIGEADEKYRRVDVKYLEGALELAGRLGAKTARVNVHNPPVFPQLGHAPVEVLIEELKHLVTVAASHGTRLVLENHDEVTNSPSTMRRIFDAVGSELGFILDTGNIEPISTEVAGSFRAKRAPRWVENAEPVFRYIEEMLPYATVVHLKTYGFEPDGRSMVYDQPRAVEMVARSGFKGPVTIECASPIAPLVYPAITRSVEMLQAAL